MRCVHVERRCGDGDAPFVCLRLIGVLSYEVEHEIKQCGTEEVELVLEVCACRLHMNATEKRGGMETRTSWPERQELPSELKPVVL